MSSKQVAAAVSLTCFPAYDALCMGVPFINPIKKWKEEEPFNREHWELQHDALRDLDAPYVYHVVSVTEMRGLANTDTPQFKGNETMLRDAVEQAVNNPIGRFIREWWLWRLRPVQSSD